MLSPTARTLPIAEATEQAVAPTRSRARLILVVLSLCAVGAVTGSAFLTAGRETTDNAQVEARVAPVSARISGLVTQVLVRDNQHVNAGDVLIELDERDMLLRVESARADLAETQAQLDSSEARLALTEAGVEADLLTARGGVTNAIGLSGSSYAVIAQMRAQLVAAQAQRELAVVELKRARNLVDLGALSQSDLDKHHARLTQAEAAVKQSLAALNVAQENRNASSGGLSSANGRLMAAQTGKLRVQAAKAEVALARAKMSHAQAALDQALLNRGYARVVAGTSGVVARRNVEVGQWVSPERPLMAIVLVDDTWVVANFKEDQIANMRQGQRAKVLVDSLPGIELTGYLESLGAGTGARFALLPPDNATGNFTKVVQRVQVLVRLQHMVNVQLVPGLSAVVTVFTHDRSSLPLALAGPNG